MCHDGGGDGDAATCLWNNTTITSIKIPIINGIKTSINHHISERDEYY